MRSMARAAVVVCSPVFFAFAAASAQQPPEPADQQRALFRSTTDMVVVPVTVTDGGGRFVFGLTPQDFQITDDGARREIAQFSADRVPVSLGILLDISGSMAQDEKARSRADARWLDTRRAFELLIKRLDRRDEVFFAVFHHETALAVPWTRNHGAVMRAFDRLRPGGSTAMLDGIKLIAPAFQLARHSRRVLLLISDGQDNRVPPPGTKPGRSQQVEYMDVPLEVEAPTDARSRALHQIFGSMVAETKSAVRGSGAMLYAIGMGTRKGAYVNVPLLETLTTDSGGYVEALRDPGRISDAITRVCDDLQAQYILAFEPAAVDGKFHKIAVSTKNRRHHVRARAGYIAK
jgi:Ca-activated chloride channel family protein